MIEANKEIRNRIQDAAAAAEAAAAAAAPAGTDAAGAEGRGEAPAREDRDDGASNRSPRLNSR